MTQRRRVRGTRRAVCGLALAALATLVLPVAGATAASGGYDRVVDLTFPVAGGYRMVDSYDAPRGGNTSYCTEQGVSGRVHQATDIMVDAKMQRIHAAVGGVVTFAPETEPSYGWMLRIEGDDGLRYSYVHLNNDTPGTDDGQGGIERAYAPGVREGARVERGQFIGYAGDSGNAEGTSPHLHLEIADPAMDDPRLECPYLPDRLDPYPSLQAAIDRGDLPEDETASWTFRDVPPDSLHAASIDRLVEEAVTSGCDQRLYCPSDGVTRAQMASFLARALDLPPGDDPGYEDVPATSIHAEAIAAVAASGITTGCAETRYCPEATVTRAQMASFLARALDLRPVEGTRFDDVPSDHLHAGTINALADAEVTRGCTATTFCPGARVTRAQMASFLVRALWP